MINSRLDSSKTPTKWWNIFFLILSCSDRIYLTVPPNSNEKCYGGSGDITQVVNNHSYRYPNIMSITTQLDLQIYFEYWMSKIVNLNFNFFQWQVILVIMKYIFFLIPLEQINWISASILTKWKILGEKVEHILSQSFFSHINNIVGLNRTNVHSVCQQMVVFNMWFPFRLAWNLWHSFANVTFQWLF